MQATIIVFTGLPGTGKTTLSRNIANALSMTLIAKDDIKEIMYDTIGWNDKAFSAKLAHATFGIMEYVAAQHLRNGHSLILESNYSPSLANKRFQEWQKNYGCKVIQIVCRTETAILAKRYSDRQGTDRHPGHNDNGSIEDYTADFRRRIAGGEDQPLDVDGPVRIVDTTDFASVDTQGIEQWIHAAL